ncbi:MAG: triose-phosphate isomerase [Myxococcota bacterium]|nr:triose-phosphate isomerase [Myxococcota bacterium]MDW8362439.1 triose-phosphate isomerase [Myxococcales bacterium]
MSRPHLVRRPLVAGNWKLHQTIGAARQLAREVRNALAGPRDVQVVLAPPFTALAAVAEVLEGSGIEVAAQDVWYADQGAFTGEISAPLLLDAGARHCIVGHSERRQLCGETDALVRRKVEALLAHGMRPIACVGETLEERNAGRTLDVVLRQVDAILGGLSLHAPDQLAVAYEPVWAIGTGRNALPADAQEVHAAVRRRAAEHLGEATAAGLRILYGGSVKPDNAAELLAQPDVDGALVGGASLSAASFVAIVRAAEGRIPERG